MKVKISVYATLREKLQWKTKEVNLNKNRVDLLDVFNELPDLKKYVIENGKIREGFMILINGINIKFLSDLKIKDGDEIDIFPPGGGG